MDPPPMSLIPRHAALGSFATAILLSGPVSLLAQGSFPDRCGTGLPANEKAGYTPLPRGDVFCPLVADPKAPHSFVSLLQERSGSGV